MNIVVLEPTFLSQEDKDVLSRIGSTTFYKDSPSNTEETIKRMKDAEIVICDGTDITGDIINALSQTKLIVSAAAGYDWIDVAAARSKNILVAHCPGSNAEAVAEFTIGLLIAAARHIHTAATELTGGVHDSFTHEGKELSGRTLGVIGYGTIGKRVAEIAKNAFKMNILYTDSKSTKDDLNNLLEESDFISVNAPLNDATRDMIGDEEISHMKDGVVLVNTGRGAIIQDEALVKGLRSGKIFAVGTDVLRGEPIKRDEHYKTDNPLFGAPNILVTPHIAFNTADTKRRLSTQLVDIVQSFVNGTPKYIVPELKH